MTFKLQTYGIPAPKDRPNHSTVNTLKFAFDMLQGTGQGAQPQRAVRLGELIDAGILKLDTDGVVITGANDNGLVHIEGVETIKGHKSFAGGVDLGSQVAATAVDFSKHIALFGSLYGLNVTSGTLNAVANGKVFRHTFDGSSSFLKVPEGSATGYSQVVLSRSDGSDGGGIWLNGASQPSYVGANSINLGSVQAVNVGFVTGNVVRGYIDNANNGRLIWNGSIESSGALAALFTRDRTSGLISGVYCDAGVLRLWHQSSGDLLSISSTTKLATFAGGISAYGGLVQAHTVSGTVKVGLFEGDGTHTGYYAVFDNAGSRCGYFGYGSGSSWLWQLENSYDTVLFSGTFAGGIVRSRDDNAHSCGTSGNRWSVVYAATGSINTSDARDKTPVRSLESSERDAAVAMSKEFGLFQFLDAIAEKGEEGARLHTGMTVQRAIEIMEGFGLDPLRYAFICYDEWEAEPAVLGAAGIDQEGNEIPPVEVKPARPAGNRYSFRPDELLKFVSRGFDARLSALEAA